MDDQCLSEAKTDRVLAIYSRLVGGAVLNKADLAQQFHVTQRSIQRDIESLRCFFAEQELPQDIVYDKRSRGYRLIDNAQKKLSNSEVLAVCKILLESRSMVTDEMMPLLDRLIDCCVPEQNKAIVQSLVANERFHYVPPHHGKHLLNGLWEIGQAVRNHQVMEIQYERMKEPKLVTRRVEPVGIMFIELYRLHYAYPNQFPMDLLDVMREKPNVCKYLDIALQHISDHMLTSMHYCFY